MQLPDTSKRQLITAALIDIHSRVQYTTSGIRDRGVKDLDCAGEILSDPNNLYETLLRQSSLCVFYGDEIDWSALQHKSVEVVQQEVQAHFRKAQTRWLIQHKEWLLSTEQCVIIDKFMARQDLNEEAKIWCISVSLYTQYGLDDIIAYHNSIIYEYQEHLPSKVQQLAIDGVKQLHTATTEKPLASMLTEFKSQVAKSSTMKKSKFDKTVKTSFMRPQEVPKKQIDRETEGIVKIFKAYDETLSHTIKDWVEVHLTKAALSGTDPAISGHQIMSEIRDVISGKKIVFGDKNSKLTDEQKTMIINLVKQKIVTGTSQTSRLQRRLNPIQDMSTTENYKSNTRAVKNLFQEAFKGDKTLPVPR